MSERIGSLSAFLALLKGVKKMPGGYMALCPGHDDHAQSLSVKESDGKILVHCHAGCSLNNVLEPLGLSGADLFLDESRSPSKANRKRRPKPEHREIEAIYDYIDANGKPFQVVRTTPKGFFQRKSDGRGGYINDLKGIMPTLYHQGDIEVAITLSEPIIIVEGEKDVDNLKKLNFWSITNPMGAGKWQDRYSEALKGADVIIIPDNDDQGHKHAAEVAQSLCGKAVRIRTLELPDAKDISDWLKQGHTAAELRELSAQCPDYKMLPNIICNGRRHLRERTKDALRALYKANKPERIFCRGGTLCRISQDENRQPTIELLSEAALRGHMERSADFITVNARGEVSAISPPLDIVRDAATIGVDVWEFPPLLGITEAPVVRQDGTILVSPGYDTVTHLYYIPASGLIVPPVSEAPTNNEIKKAIAQLLEIICNFPFVSQASYANTVAVIMLPVIHPMVGLAPMAVFDKPQPGTGASLLADITSLIATGREAATMGAPRSEEECEKKLSSHLLEGRKLCIIDNVDNKLWSDTLARYLTSKYISIRPLGRSADIRLQNNLIYIITGNNVQLGGDLPRRCFWIRLDAQMARPWLREGFKQPRLRRFVIENRGTILAAILTIVRAWIAAGRPIREKLPPLGSYEDFARVVSGILDFMGVEEFLANLEDMYSTMDKDTLQWECFLSEWSETFGDTPITVKQLVEKIGELEDLTNALPDNLIPGNEKEKGNYHRRLGNALARRCEVRHPNGLVLRKAGISHNATTWKVEMANANSPEFVAKGEFGEFLPTLTQSTQKNSKNNNIYKREKGERNSLNSPPKLKRGELTPRGKDRIVLSDGRFLNWSWCLSMFAKLGYPCMTEINEYDISIYLYPERLSPEKLQRIVHWLEEHSGQKMEEDAMSHSNPKQDIE